MDKRRKEKGLNEGKGQKRKKVNIKGNEVKGQREGESHLYD